MQLYSANTWSHASAVSRSKWQTEASRVGLGLDLCFVSSPIISMIMYLLILRGNTGTQTEYNNPPSLCPG